MISITDLIVPLEYNEKTLLDIVAGLLHIEPCRIEHIRIVKRTVDARDRQDIHFKMDAAVYISGDESEILSIKRDKRVTKGAELQYTVPKDVKFKDRPVVVGCGPAGMFAALVLAEAGARPILLERGLDVERRRESVLKFWHTGILNTKTNVQFGEGGAGAFSDGKLKVGSLNPAKWKVLSEFVKAGAPPEIMYLGKPHIGTDRLYKAVKHIRQKTEGLGGEIHFDANVTEILRKNGQVTGVRFMKNGEYNELPSNHVVLAIGHSARDTFEKLLESGVILEQKPFAVGVRIEHPQELINKIQYGSFSGHPALSAADYRMVVHLGNGRGVYTFCMCPGGYVVAAASEENALVTNGMSEYARDGKNANTALLVTLGRKDLGSAHPLAGIAFQRKIEAAAFIAGGGGYKAPVQRLEDFLKKRPTASLGDVLPTYLPGTHLSEIDSYLPGDITDSLRKGIEEMSEWMSGFYYPDALLTGVETRSASTVRITREESLEAVGIKGLYPCGEGAGYAGGIVSAAVDGILCAERIISG